VLGRHANPCSMDGPATDGTVKLVSRLRTRAQVKLDDEPKGLDESRGAGLAATAGTRITARNMQQREG
jgi:hypothetical protein